jgi:hypothetical protein
MELTKPSALAIKAHFNAFSLTTRRRSPAERLHPTIISFYASSFLVLEYL